MENVDKDVAAMIANLKKYDKLVESFVPMAPMGRLAEKKKVNEKELDAPADEIEIDPDLLKEKSKKPWEKKEKKTDTKVDEGVDPEVLAWMSRFAKLGNMKGYGR